MMNYLIKEELKCKVLDDDVGSGPDLGKEFEKNWIKALRYQKNGELRASEVGVGAQNQVVHQIKPKYDQIVTVFRGGFLGIEELINSNSRTALKCKNGQHSSFALYRQFLETEKLSYDFSELLNDNEEYNVIIEVDRK
ncbi:hypothetical protein Glove_65g115 [Diversispora epigaea]|uniref:Uncharacterized protein n=1 Tax=Diversispora epigaea TaxID=1348612 RepID=A0A397JBV3_9GLOM|nr:hypothetical protein Glove_65g115 [Diversispora epigaea]